MLAAMKSGKDSGAFRRIKADETLKVRFLTEMDQWEKGYSHYDNNADQKFMWCSRRDDCPRCEIGDRPSYIWLANAFDREAGKVQVVQVPVRIAKQLAYKDKANGTITDRDYDIIRTGSTLNDTTYMLSWDDAKRFNSSRYELIDIPAAIMTELGLGEDDEDEEDEQT